MEKYASLSILFFSIFSALWLNGAIPETPQEVENWFKSLSHEKPPEKMTKLHFYFHDLLKGKIRSSAYVAQSNLTASSPTSFGAFLIADDPVTVGPSFWSKRLGYLKGFYATASIEDIGLMTVMTFVFTDEVYNGSSLSVSGWNPAIIYREIPVIGGTGKFRLARGSATLHNYFYDPVKGNASVEVNAVVLHY